MLKDRSGQTTVHNCYFQRGTAWKIQNHHRKCILDIVGELKLIINEEGIKTGGKLPSERELAERLQAGRSTIREALRSLELLGLIETRRGEGTFLADYRKHQFVEVLAAFIMQQPDSVFDVQETREEFMKWLQSKQYVKRVHYGTYQYGKVLLTKIDQDGEILPRGHYS